eukprot:445399-Alexandrium_andersonii.AAC.1
MVSSTIVKSSLVAACGVPGTGTCAPSEGGTGEGGTGVSGEAFRIDLTSEGKSLDGASPEDVIAEKDDVL